MAGLNKVMIIGNLGTDPEMRYTANGNAVTTFRVACSRSFSGPDGERKEETEWFTVVTWNKLAETCSQYLQKGRRAYIEGRLQTRSWEGPDGQRKYIVWIDRRRTPSSFWGSNGDKNPLTGGWGVPPKTSRAGGWE